MKQRNVAAAACILLSALGVTRGSILFQDVLYWMPDGSTQINPTSPPTSAVVKVQETVYDDAQGRAILQQQIDLGFTHGDVIPSGPINVYGYSITNLNYGNGASGNGLGIGGFIIPDVAGLGGEQWAPIAANSRWHEASGGVGNTYEWAIDADGDLDDGDGLAILLGQSFNSFYLAVPDGTPHGFIDGAAVHTWTGGGLSEESGGATAIDFVHGMVSGPVPEPATLSFAVLSAGALLRRRLRNID